MSSKNRDSCNDDEDDDDDKLGNNLVFGNVMIWMWVLGVVLVYGRQLVHHSDLEWGNHDVTSTWNSIVKESTT